MDPKWRFARQCKGLPQSDVKPSNHSICSKLCSLGHAVTTNQNQSLFLVCSAEIAGKIPENVHRLRDDDGPFEESPCISVGSDQDASTDDTIHAIADEGQVT